MALNENLSFSDVRYLINSKVSSYDPALSFIGYPQKVLLTPGETLVRLDFSVVFGIFTRLWWMKAAVLNDIIRGADPGSTALRRAWQQQQAMPKAGKGVRTQILEIAITQDAYAWIGPASPLFNKSGGAEQIYLPNLSSGTGPDQSDYEHFLIEG